MKTPLAISAYSCAQQLKMWLAEERNYLHSEIFSSTLVRALHGCFHHAHSGFKLQHERLCENFFKLKCSEWYKDLWMKFLHDTICREACPIFYQAITDTIMDELTKKQFPVVTQPSFRTKQHPHPLLVAMFPVSSPHTLLPVIQVLQEDIFQPL